MKCNEFEQLMNEYIDGELTHSIDIVEEHINTCQTCKAMYEETLELKAMLSDLDMIDLPDDFEESLHEKLVAVNNETVKNVTPIRKWQRQFKVVGSLAAVLLVSVLAVKSFPMMGNDFNSASNKEMATESFAMDTDDAAEENFAMETEATEEESLDNAVVADAAVTSSVPEASQAKALTLRMPSQVYVNEGRSFYVNQANEDLINELLLDIVYEELMISYNQYEFFILNSEVDKLSERLYEQFVVTDEIRIDYSYELDDFKQRFDSQEDYLESLKGDYESAEGERKSELSERIELETSIMDTYEIDLKKIDKLKGYTHIIILVNEE